MLRIISLFILITLTSNTITFGQSLDNHEKFQTIPAKHTSEIIVNSVEEDHYRFADNKNSDAAVVIKIEVTSETFPTRILEAMMEQGDFNVRYKTSGGKLVISQLKKTQEVRFNGKTHVLDFNYKILVPASLANEYVSQESQFCLQSVPQTCCPYANKVPTI